MVIWIIGISGSGKSFLAKKILNKIKGKKIHVDGDEVRKYLTNNLGYTKRDRKKNSVFISNLCEYLENKGFIVICSILSIFREHQLLNRKRFKKYFQIYIKTNRSIVLKRNHQNIYSKKSKVVGKDITFPVPVKNDITVVNNFENYKENTIKNIIKKITNVKKN